MIYAFEEIIVFVFRIINFAVLLALLVYVFKRYLLKTILAQIEAKKAVIHSLISTDHTLVRQQNALARKTAEDQEEQSRLKEKLMRWRAAIDDRRAQLYDMREQRMESFKDLLAAQEAQIQSAVVARTVLPAVVDETRKILMKEYAAQEEQKEFMSKLAALMQGERE